MRPAEPWGAHHSGAPAMPKNTPLSEASPTPGADVVAPLSDIKDHAATQLLFLLLLLSGPASERSSRDETS